VLTKLRFQNFKAWKDTDQVRLAPLTIIFGANSAGKSSLGHLLLALKQTALSSDRRRALHLGDENSLVDLGTYDELIHGHNLGKNMTFGLEWKLPRPLEVKDPLQLERSRGDILQLVVQLATAKSGQPEVTSLEYRLSDDGHKDIIKSDYKRNKAGQFELTATPYKLIRTAGRVWPLEEPEKFYRVSEQSRARFQNAAFLSDFALSTEEMLSKVYYLGPLREYPKRSYQWSGDTPEDVGQRGEFAIAAILAAQSQDRKLNRGPRKKQQPFAEFIANWLQDLGIIHSFRVKPVSEGRRDYEVLVKTHATSAEVKITDVGFGVSQVLPAIVQAFYCEPDSVIWMEQPEIHLHPQVQAELADVFISAIKARENGVTRNVQLIIESHSEHFLNRIQRRIADETLSPKDVAIYFARNTSPGGATLEPLKVNEYGDIENWPENFFGDEMADLTARTVAAMKRKKENKQKI
jgi:predicted ATPase